MSILYLMAAKAEFGPHLAARIQPEMIGIGPVEAAIATHRAGGFPACGPAFLRGAEWRRQPSWPAKGTQAGLAIAAARA